MVLNGKEDNMLIGDPYKFAVLFDRVKKWNPSLTDNNGFFALCIDGKLFPDEIENAVRLYETGNDNALKLIDNLLISQREINREIVSNALISIAQGNAAAKNRNVMCILHSLGQKCPYTDSHNCIGCEYEILTKGAIYKLSLEYQRNKKLMKETKNVLMKNKYKEILTRSIMPAMNEILTYIYNCGGKEKIMQLEHIIREVTDNE